MRYMMWIPIQAVAWGLLMFVAGATIAAEEPVPAAPQPAKPDAARITVMLVGGQRVIRVQDADGHTMIREENGKNITLSQIRTVNGRQKLETFRAVDPQALEKDHPAASKLYRKYIEQAANVPPQIIAGAPVPQPGQARYSSQGVGDRQIRATLRGRRIEIDDRYGTQIRMKLIDRAVADAVPRTIEAASLKELKEQDADAAEIYVRLTGQQ